MRDAKTVARDAMYQTAISREDKLDMMVAIIEARDAELVEGICQLVGRHAEAGLVRLIRHKWKMKAPAACGGCRGPDCEGCGQSSHWYWWRGGEKPQTK